MLKCINRVKVLSDADQSSASDKSIEGQGSSFPSGSGCMAGTVFVRVN